MTDNRLTADQRNSFIAALLGWTMDAFDYDAGDGPGRVGRHPRAHDRTVAGRHPRVLSRRHLPAGESVGGLQLTDTGTPRRGPRIPVRTCGHGRTGAARRRCTDLDRYGRDRITIRIRTKR